MKAFFLNETGSTHCNSRRLCARARSAPPRRQYRRGQAVLEQSCRGSRGYYAPNRTKGATRGTSDVKRCGRHKHQVTKRRRRRRINADANSRPCRHSKYSRPGQLALQCAQLGFHQSGNFTHVGTPCQLRLEMCNHFPHVAGRHSAYGF